MATYSEKVVYDWSDPAQLNDWDIIFSGGTGSVSIVNGELVIAPVHGASCAANILSKRADFNAVEVVYRLSDNTSSSYKYFDIGIGSLPLLDDVLANPGSSFWHQYLQDGVMLLLQDPGANTFIVDMTSGVKNPLVANLIGPSATALNTVGNTTLFALSEGDGSGIQATLNGTKLADLTTTKAAGRVLIHQGWYSPNGWGAHARLQKVTLYKNYDPLGGMVVMPSVSLSPIPANQETRAQFQPQDVAWVGGEGKGYAGPVNSNPLDPVLLCAGLDRYWLRDGVQDVLQGYIESTVTIDGEGVARRVLCFDQAGNLVGETMSRASDGKYRFDLLWLNRRYMLVAQDDPAFGPADYNAVAADYQLPTPYAPGEGVGLA